MPFQDLSRESNLLELLFWTARKRRTLTEPLDKNGIIKEMKERELKKLDKLKKRNDSICKLYLTLLFGRKYLKLSKIQYH